MTDADIKYIKALSTNVLEAIIERLNDSKCPECYCNSCELCHDTYCINDIIRGELRKR